MIQARDADGKFAAEKVPAKKEEAKTEEAKTEEAATVFKDKLFVIGRKRSGGIVRGRCRRRAARSTTKRLMDRLRTSPRRPGPRKNRRSRQTTPEELAALGLACCSGRHEGLRLSTWRNPAPSTTAISKEGRSKSKRSSRYSRPKRSTFDSGKMGYPEVKTLARRFRLAGRKRKTSYILKTKLAQLKDAEQPSRWPTCNPSKARRIYRRPMRPMAWPGLQSGSRPRIRRPPPPGRSARPPYERSQAQPTIEKKKATSSTLLGTSGETQTRKTDPKTGKLPEITPDMRRGGNHGTLQEKRPSPPGENPDEDLSGCGQSLNI